MLGVFLRASRKKAKNDAYSASILNWLCTHVTDTKELTGFLDNILMEKIKKPGQTTRVVKEDKKPSSNNGDNDIDAFLSFIQEINN